MKKRESPQDRKRDALSQIYTAVIFGGITCPFYYIAVGVLGRFSPTLSAIALPALAVSTSVLFVVFIRESRVELVLKQRSGRFFGALLRAVIVFCIAVSIGILAIIANFTLLSSVEYWFYLIMFLVVSSVFSMLIVYFAPESRLEKALFQIFRNCSGVFAWYRALAYLALIFGAAVSCGIAYQFYLSTPAMPG